MTIQSKNENPNYKKILIWCHSPTIWEYIPGKLMQNLKFYAFCGQFLVEAHENFICEFKEKNDLEKHYFQASFFVKSLYVYDRWKAL